MFEAADLITIALFVGMIVVDYVFAGLEEERLRRLAADPGFVAAVDSAFGIADAIISKGSYRASLGRRQDEGTEDLARETVRAALDLCVRLR